jgi:hypothetical protein
MPQPEASVQSKLDQLRALFDPLTPLYVLIDPMVGEPLPAIGIVEPGVDATPLREEAWGRGITPVVLAKSVALPPHQHPYLVLLQGTDDPLLEMTIEVAEGERQEAQADGLAGTGRAAHRIGGWLQSGMRETELAELLSTMCRVSTAARTSATYLRLVDRRVLDLLCHACGVDRVASQFGRLQSWTYLDPQGGFQCLRSSSEHGERLRLERDEWQRLERGDMLHRTLAHFLGESEQMQAWHPQKLYPLAEAAVLEAVSASHRWPHRFQNSSDEVIWAALCLLYPSLPSMSAVDALLDVRGNAEDPPEPLRYLFSEIQTIVQQNEV